MAPTDFEVLFTIKASANFEANKTDGAYNSFRFLTHALKSIVLFHVRVVVYDRNHYFGLGPKPKLADTFGRYRN